MRSNKRRFLHFNALALTAALAAMVFLSSGLALWHTHGSGTVPSCTVCHIVHMPVLHTPGSVAPALALLSWVLPYEISGGHRGSYQLFPPPRAPPA